jgi:DNA repair exonuclease SbcCD nuclease subunit
MELHNTLGSFRHISLKKSLNALLLGDLHFAQEGSYFSYDSIQDTLQVFQFLLLKVKPDQVILLGDLFHRGQKRNDFVSKIMQVLHEIKQEVFLLSGNHDHRLINALKNDWDTSDLHICSSSFLVYETTSDRIIFTHDGNNPFWLYKSEIPDFLMSLKRDYELNSKHWLITGHTHLPCLLEELKVASLGCFNVEVEDQVLSYGIVKESPHTISFKLQSHAISQ